MDKTTMQETQESLYNTDLKHIEVNLEKFIQKKEEISRNRRNLSED